MLFRLISLVSLVALGLFAQETQYVVRFPNAIHHEAEITATFTGLSSPTLDVTMSRSSPGRYAAADFAKNIYGVHATGSGGVDLPLTRVDPQTWRIKSKGTTASFHYTLFGDRVDGTYAAIDNTHAHLNMPAAFVWSPAYKNDLFRFRFELPDGQNWKVATQLQQAEDGSFTAPNLEQMMDGPVELSAHYLEQWEADHHQFRLALHGGDAEFSRAYARVCHAIVLEEEGVFGAFPVYDGGNYTFLADFLPYASGDGMEHRDSTVMTGMPGPLLKGPAGTAAHEFFHSWNVRRIRPRNLEPFDFERPNMSGELWFAEGFTNYYGLLTLARLRVLKPDEFFAAMGMAVNEVLTSPGRQAHSPVGMSQLAPFVDAAAYIDLNNFRNTFISYYTYGQALAFGLDLAIRERFPSKSLDDWMREVWRTHPDIDRPYTLDDLESCLAATTGSKEFAHDIFSRHITGTEPLGYAALVEKFGLVLRHAHEASPYLGIASSGGRRNDAAPPMTFSKEGARLTGTVMRDSPFYKAGLESGDVLISWGGKKLDAKSIPDALLERRSPGDKVEAVIRSRSGDRMVIVQLEQDPQLELVRLDSVAKPVPEQAKRLQNDLLRSHALAPLPDISDLLEQSKQDKHESKKHS